MALYVYVASVAIIVSMLGLASLTVLRVERRRGAMDADSLAARQNALAAIELARLEIRNNMNWRTNFTHAVETNPLSFGEGTISWILSDPTDSNLADDPLDPVDVRGIGRVGESVWVHQMRLDAVPIYTATSLASSPGSLITTSDKLSKSRWLGQYFRPSFPAEAISWRVTHAEIYCIRTNAVDFTANLYTPNGSGMPGTLLERINVAGSSTPTTWSYFRCHFVSHSGLTPGAGLLFGLESTQSNDSIELRIETNLLTSSSRYRIGGAADKGWDTKISTESLRYRIFGEYMTVKMEPKRGAWQRAAL